MRVTKRRDPRDRQALIKVLLPPRHHPRGLAVRPEELEDNAFRGVIAVEVQDEVLRGAGGELGSVLLTEEPGYLPVNLLSILVY